MKIVREQTIFPKKNIIAIGSFDGLHKAHRYIIGRAKQKAMVLGLNSLVYTFDMPPSLFFDAAQKALFTKTEKVEVFRELGIDYLDMQTFDAALADMSAEAFIEYLILQLQAAYIIVGFNFRFGQRAQGTPELLQAAAKKYEVQVEAVKPICLGGQIISSTQIRTQIRKGNVEQAAMLLGAPYFVEGKVAHGKQLGRQLGFATANLVPNPSKLLPAFGVYVARVFVENAVYQGVTNVGCRPTVDDGKTVTVETHLLGQEQDLYGKKIKVEFLQKLRAEKAFAGLDELKKQIGKDKAAAKQYFAKHK